MDSGAGVWRAGVATNYRLQFVIVYVLLIFTQILKGSAS